MKKTLIVLLSFSSMAMAQNSASASKDVQPAAQLSTNVSGRPAWLSNVILGIKTYNDTGRFGYAGKDAVPSKDPKNPGDGDTNRQYKGKYEGKIGAKADSGWGGYVQFTEYRYEYEQSQYSKWSHGDTSLSLVHPTLYKNDSVTMVGTARYYLPTTDRSRLKGINQFAYYQDTFAKLPYGWDLFNEINPRIFMAHTYGASDSRYKVEDIAELSHNFNSWSRWGLGTWIQHEGHAETSPGTTADVYPHIDYMLDGTKSFISGRLYMPVYVTGSVYDASHAADPSDAWFQVYFQANL